MVVELVSVVASDSKSVVVTLFSSSVSVSRRRRRLVVFPSSGNVTLLVGSLLLLKDITLCPEFWSRVSSGNVINEDEAECVCMFGGSRV